MPDPSILEGMPWPAVFIFAVLALFRRSIANLVSEWVIPSLRKRSGLKEKKKEPEKEARD